MNSGGEDDIDRALSELQMSLEGSHVSSTPADIMHIPELADYLKFMKCVAGIVIFLSPFFSFFLFFPSLFCFTSLFFSIKLVMEKAC